jgi:hypothetical protein
MGWLQSIRRALFSLGGSTYDAVHAKNKRLAPTGILRSEDSELPPTERRKLLSATRNRDRIAPQEARSWLFDYPRVRVLNVCERFPTLAKKLRWMIDQTRGELLCRWDDDDISLPWRLHLSVDQLGDRLEWHPCNYWYCPPGKVLHDNGHGNDHVQAIFRPELLDRIGGYRALTSGIPGPWSSASNEVPELSPETMPGPPRRGSTQKSIEGRT